MKRDAALRRSCLPAGQQSARKCYRLVVAARTPHGRAATPRSSRNIMRYFLMMMLPMAKEGQRRDAMMAAARATHCRRGSFAMTRYFIRLRQQRCAPFPAMLRRCRADIACRRGDGLRHYYVLFAGGASPIFHDASACFSGRYLAEPARYAKPMPGYCRPCRFSMLAWRRYGLRTRWLSATATYVVPPRPARRSRLAASRDAADAEGTRGGAFHLLPSRRPAPAMPGWGHEEAVMQTLLALRCFARAQEPPPHDFTSPRAAWRSPISHRPHAKMPRHALIFTTLRIGQPASAAARAG